MLRPIKTIHKSPQRRLTHMKALQIYQPELRGHTFLNYALKLEGYQVPEQRAYIAAFLIHLSGKRFPSSASRTFINSIPLYKLEFFWKLSQAPIDSALDYKTVIKGDKFYFLSFLSIAGRVAKLNPAIALIDCIHESSADYMTAYTTFNPSPSENVKLVRAGAIALIGKYQ